MKKNQSKQTLFQNLTKFNCFFTTTCFLCSKDFKQTNLSQKQDLNTEVKSFILKPIVIYSKLDIYKVQILKDNKHKAGVYRLVNKVNNKTYIGSSINITSRFYKYFNIHHLLKHKTTIHKALLKYGYLNFSLEILEYCNKNISVSREQYYIDLLKPDYNILQTAGSSLGFKHSPETLDFFRNSRKISEQTRKNLSRSATGRVLSDLAKNKISASRVGIKLSAKIRANMSAATTALIGVPVVVKNIQTNTETKYINLTEAAKAIGVTRTAVKKALDSERILKKTYYITLWSRVY